MFDEEGAKIVKELVDTAKQKNVKLVFPVDYVTASDFSNDAKVGYATDKDGIPDDWEGLDCGKESNQIFRDEIMKAKTIVWNGPPGVFEFSNFANGTKSLLQAVIDATAKGATSIIGKQFRECCLFGGEEKKGPLCWCVSYETTQPNAWGFGLLLRDYNLLYSSYYMIYRWW